MAEKEKKEKRGMSKGKRMRLIALIVLIATIILTLLLLALYWDDIFGNKKTISKGGGTTITCGDGLYDAPGCKGMCDPSQGQKCLTYKGCYRCVCPDIIVKSVSGVVQRNTSTVCGGDAYESCTTTCKLYAEFAFDVENSGTGYAGTSGVEFDFAPGIKAGTEAIPALEAGSDAKKFYTTNKTGTVTGRSNACSELDWWVATYTITMKADNGNAIVECNEENNIKSAQVTPS